MDCKIRLFVNYRTTLIVILAMWACLLPVCAQWVPATLLSPPALSKVDSSKLSLKADITGFFKNNEYFSPVASGQTLPGVSSTLA